MALRVAQLVVNSRIHEIGIGVARATALQHDNGEAGFGELLGKNASGPVKTRGGKTFDQLSPADRTTALKAIEAGQAEFAQVPARTFFSLLLQNTVEGYFADPMYGGNRNRAVWKMIGFPGAIGMYREEIEKYRNKPYDVEPTSIQDLS